MITVIIPSKGRSTLNRALHSLLNQTNSEWLCYVIFDGVEIDNTIFDDRIIYYSSPKLGNSLNGAGLVRNKGIDLSESKWLCFLDDDDTFSQFYIHDLYNEINKNNEIDVCIFKMTYSPDCDKIIPPFDCNQLEIGQVGISFAVKKEFIDKYNIRFNNSSVEDYQFLVKCRDHGAKILFSDKVNYFVNHGFI